MRSSLCNCIALYDYSIDRCDLKGWFSYMEQWAQEIGIPLESVGITTSRKLIQFHNGKKKLEKTNYKDITEIEIYGSVSEPGTHLNWKTSASFFVKCNGLRQTMDLCFPDTQQPFHKGVISSYLTHLLSFGDFKYGICYQRPYNMGPADYAGGVISTSGRIELSKQDRKKISTWSHEYTFDDGSYRTGLLRDVYPFNILIDTHLNEKVGTQTLKEWIDLDPTHGTLDKLTDTHWLWSIDPVHIPAAQEALQEAGLLLCYRG